VSSDSGEYNKLDEALHQLVYKFSKAMKKMRLTLLEKEHGYIAILDWYILYYSIILLSILSIISR